MSEEWMKAAMWGLVTLAMLIVLWSSWRTYRADQAKLQKLQDFRERYNVEMTQLYRWFASDECALMVLDWLDLQLAGGDLRPDGSRRLEVAIHGLQAVRQAVRDSHFNDRCRGAADASCAMSVVVAASSQPRVTPEQMAELRNACLEGVDLDRFMALCLNQLLEGRTVKVITERREYLNPRPELAPFDRISEPVVRRIVNDLGEQVWPCAEAPKDGEPSPSHVQVIYEVVEPTVDEKVDEVLRLVRLFENAWDSRPRAIGREEQQAMRAAQRTMRQAPGSEVERETIRAVFLRNGFTIKEGQTDLKPYVYAAAEELLSIARASWQRTQSVVAVVPDALREAVEYLDDNPFNEIGAGSILHRAMRDAATAQPAALSYKDDPRSPSELSLAGCRCVRFGEGNPHWPCKIHPAQPAAQGETRMGEPHIAQGQQVECHPDDAAVDRFAEAMKAKLARSREKGRHGWQNCTAPHLSAMLYDHLYKADPLDVGNFAMMLHQNGQAIELPFEARGRHTTPQPAPAQDVAGLVEAASGALAEIQAVMQEAYNSATSVCCGRGISECCGSPDPEWSEHDQRTMDRFAPHELALRAALAAHDKQSGGEV